ncbi:fasciclin domain-containing protein [Salegentibacter sp.]|uniref:fasciclin domain-containing protein n=1 Tax=Salegentibacter sp. TaxID=1903072 RepID=UPI00356178B6
MKNYALPIAYSRVPVSIFLIVLLSFFLVSCEKEDVVTETESYEMTVYDVLEANSTKKPEADNKKGAPAPGDESIATIAIEGGFNELVGALIYVDEELDAGLVDLFMNGTDQYTVFAPNDAAFEELYKTLDDKGINVTPELVLNVLLYHVTEGRRAANSVVPPKNYRTIETLLGESFNVNPEREITAVGNTANIVTPDISASNGIIHVIDTVILPISIE